MGGFPAPMANRPMRMSITSDAKGEQWHRDFDGHTLSSTVRQVSPTDVAERFGPFDVHMRPSVTEDGLEMPVSGIHLLGIPMPAFLFRGSGGRETVDKTGQITFYVSSRVWWLGCVIDYSGTLVPSSTSTLSQQG
ncbi:hypothetical protein GCM10007385_21420 [Tateyamaria omphalii]|nr:hypothetical protein GCM10007385_21420 [Tateyamaria omphalii]